MNTYVKTENGDFVRIVDDDEEPTCCCHVEEEEEVEKRTWEDVTIILNDLIVIGCSLYTSHKMLQLLYGTTKPKREE